MELRHENGSMYISGIGQENKEIKIPSQMFPLSGEIEFVYSDNTEDFDESERTQKIKDIYNSVDYTVGKCYDNVDKLSIKLTNAGIKHQTYVGWTFTDFNYPVHHCFIGVDNHVLDYNVRTSLFSAKVNEMYDLGITDTASVRRHMAKWVLELHGKNHSEYTTFGKMDLGIFHIASECKPKYGEKMCEKLIKAFKKHPSFDNMTNGANDLHREMWKLGI